jgi:hypothetical protein
MRKILLWIAALVMAPNLIFAQQGQPPQTQPYQPAQVVQPAAAAPKPEFPFQFGIKIAPNLGWMKPTADEYSSEGARAGFTFGLIGDYNFTDNYAITFGINSVSTGGKLLVNKDVDSVATDVTTTYKLRYFEIPVMLKMRTNDINGIQYYVQVGLGTNFLYRTHGEEEYNDITQSVDISEEVNFMKETFLLGVGMQTKISGNTKFVGGLMFSNGFTDILSGKDEVTTNGSTKDFNASAINNYLELSLGILF